MDTNLLLIATLLIIIPQGEHAGVEKNSVLAWYIDHNAIVMELIDYREIRYGHTNINDLNDRYLRLKDAPSVSDSLRFPDRDYVGHLLDFNRTYYHHINNLKSLAWDVTLHDRALTETDQLYMIWDAVRDIKSEFYYVSIRRTRLAELRKVLGEEAYYAGRLPPHVPIWRFNQIK